MATTTQGNKGGIRGRGAATVWHTGQTSPATTTTGTDTTPVVTETYFAVVFVPVNATLTGASLLNGSAVAGNVNAILYNEDGVAVAQSASTAQSGTAAFQDFAFATAYEVTGPARLVVGFQFSSTSARFRTHILGRFGAAKKTGETYGTATTITVPTTFTTAQGPIASTY